ncbi:MAG TPA: redoxin domain-containing protein, partial [Bacteroidales bacterium]|nr:redoxin domain-containing protein [Bacteroidales bacterium]
SISLLINNFNTKLSVLYSIKGSKYIPIDTAILKKNTIIYSFNKPLPKGVYKISLNDTLFVDIIADTTNIEMATDSPNIIENMKILKSKENEIYYDYLKYYKVTYDSALRYKSDADMIKAINGGKDNYQSNELRQKYYNLIKSIRSYSLNLAKNNPDLFASKVILGSIMPDYDEYMESPNAVPYNNLRDFYKEHFFDNIDLADNNLLRTNIIYNAVNDYITNFADPPSDQSYIESIDFILKKASVNPEVFQYLLELFITTFGSSPWEKVYIYLIDNYILNGACGIDISTRSNYINRAEAMKKLEYGNPAPEVQLADTLGKIIPLYNVKAKYILLFFWNTACEHCEKAIPELIKIYNKYKDKEFEIYAIAITNSLDIWKHKIIENKMTWINVSDLKGNNSPLMLQFNIWSTPHFFILDKNKKILERPLNVESINNFLENTYKL